MACQAIIQISKSKTAFSIGEKPVLKQIMALIYNNLAIYNMQQVNVGIEL